MASPQIEADLEAIEQVVASYPDGISRTDLEDVLEQRLGRPIHWRTLLRRLDVLRDEQRIEPRGDKTGRLYFPGPALATARPEPEEGYVPLTREGARVRGLVRRPLMDRPVVGYNRDLLDSYVPGRTWYLSREDRERLHDQGRTPDESRPAGTYAREIYSRLLIDLAWASSRLEGNTYTRLDTQNLLEFGQRVEGADLAEAQMILNHKSAIELLVSEAETVGFNLYTFQNLHAALSENLVGDPADEGRLRQRIVNVTGTTFHPLGVPQQVEELFRLLLAKADAIPDPFEQAFFVMVHLPYLQPFVDVNKRTARLGANLPLIKANLIPLSFVDVPEKAYVEGMLGVYELGRVDLLRDVFVWAYERSCARYRVVRDQMGEQDPIRLRYRLLLREVVRETVVSQEAPSRARLQAWAKGRVPEEHEEAFAEAALALLLALHEGSAARYDIRPAEFVAWRTRYGPTPQLGLF